MFLLVIDTPDFYKYVVANLLTANFLMPSFISDIPALNGSLWTIKIETLYYLFLPFLFPLLASRRFLPVAMIGSFVWAVGLPHEELARQLPGKFYLFAIGVLLARSPRILEGGFSTPALILLPFSLVLYFMVKETLIIGDLLCMLSSVFFVLIFLRRWIHWEPMDISYTLYLVHYPIEVMVTRYIAPGLPFWKMLALSMVLALVTATILSLLVERPALKIGRKLVRRLNSAPISLSHNDQSASRRI
jgi:peptidoglycan/LPS O-acetylase OafA/YrhL